MDAFYRFIMNMQLNDEFNELNQDIWVSLLLFSHNFVDL